MEYYYGFVGHIIVLTSTSNTLAISACWGREGCTLSRHQREKGGKKA